MINSHFGSRFFKQHRYLGCIFTTPKERFASELGGDIAEIELFSRNVWVWYKVSRRQPHKLSAQIEEASSIKAFQISLSTTL